AQKADKQRHQDRLLGKARDGRAAERARCLKQWYNNSNEILASLPQFERIYPLPGVPVQAIVDAAASTNTATPGDPYSIYALTPQNRLFGDTASSKAKRDAAMQQRVNSRDQQRQ
ncbi:hypothetical protein KIPB_016693, partial [Kipferlia bialata]